jgi:hypothetical protein
MSFVPSSIITNLHIFKDSNDEQVIIGIPPANYHTGCGCPRKTIGPEDPKQAITRDHDLILFKF